MPANERVPAFSALQEGKWQTFKPSNESSR
jgi:hypothetical protein